MFGLHRLEQIKENNLFSPYNPMIKDLLPEFSLGLSPMDEITTPEYRQICKSYGADVIFTEFVSSDALIRDVEKSYKKIAFSQEERPLAVQIFGNDEKALVDAALRVEELKPDWIDINWGCPMKRIAGKGAGSGILQDIPRMIKLTKAVVDNVKIPVSVKTRLGYDESDKPIVETAERLQDIGIQLISIHGRTKTQMYRGQADWTLIGKTKENPRLSIPVFGNGDIDSVEKFIEYKERYSLDGILVGRHAIGNPYFFLQCKQALKNEPVFNPSLQEKTEICLRHLHLSAQINGEERACTVMRKFYPRYFLGVRNFKPYKLKLLVSKTIEEVEQILSQMQADCN
ncbi:MAG: tRNA-dihydrouridine synthase family protein [Bacteroidales bacterium]|nr:tRNA-dihydrouridine synthase family protein [Bacteroidales bacterium]